MASPVSAGALVDRARDYHPSLDPRRVPPKAALRYLSRYQRRIAEKVFQLSEEALAETLVIPQGEVEAAVSQGFSGPGIDLGHLLFILKVYARGREMGGVRELTPVSLAAYNSSGREFSWPTAYLFGQKLYPAPRPSHGVLFNYGDASTITAAGDWWDFDGLSVLAVRVPPELVNLESSITLPTMAHDALVENLALWMAQRAGVLKELPDLPRTASEAEAAAISALASQDRSSTWTVQ